MQFECVSRLNGWNEQEPMGNLVATLWGQATDILNVVPDGVLTSTHICDALNHQFRMSVKCDLLRVQLLHRRLRPGETLQELESGGSGSGREAEGIGHHPDIKGVQPAAVKFDEGKICSWLVAAVWSRSTTSAARFWLG